MAKTKLTRVYNIDAMERIARPADLIVFAGCGSEQRAGLILQSKIIADGKPTEGFLYQVVSVVSRGGLSRLSIQPLAEAIYHHDGPVYLGHLNSKVRAGICIEDMFDYIFSRSYNHTRGYEMGSEPHPLSWIPYIRNFVEPIVTDPRPDFSVDFVRVAYAVAGLFDSNDVKGANPLDLLRLKIFTNELYQLKGNEQPVEGFNTVVVPVPVSEEPISAAAGQGFSKC